jgi:hypothetical protein
MRSERSIYFAWLEMIIENYEEDVGDNKGKELWNWCVDRFKPDGFKKIEEEDN